MIPTLALSYTVFGLFLAAVRLFANPVVASAVFHQGAVLLVLFLFAPLLAGWAIVVGMAASVSARRGGGAGCWGVGGRGLGGRAGSPSPKGRRRSASRATSTTSRQDW